MVVIAIRDITKGEEITVDYSLTEWGENLVSVFEKKMQSKKENV